MKRTAKEIAAAKAKKSPAKKRNIKAKAATTSARKAATVKAFAHWSETDSPYHGVTGSVRGVLICAAFVVAGFAKLNKTNIAKAPKGNKALFVGLVGPTPWNYHKNHKRIGSDNQLSAGGIAWFQNRIADKAARDLTAALIAAMQKGGKVEGLNFHREVAGS